MVVSGVSGSGKTVVGTAVAERLAVPFADADTLHSAESIAKMRAGTPLEDDDRWPWLDRAGAWLAEHDASGGVLACSALKRVYRDRLRAAAPRSWFVQLVVAHADLEHRLASRSHHFMPGSLLDSQLGTLEPLTDDEAGVTLDASRSVDAVVDVLLRNVRSRKP